MPPNIDTIGYGSLDSCYKLTQISFPDSLTTIQGYSNQYGCAIGCCITLSTIKFGDNPKLKFIGSNAFYQCTNLETIVFPNSLSSI